mgnify:FL=1
MIVAGFIFISPISLTLTREQFYSNGKVAAERIYLIGNTLILKRINEHVHYYLNSI